MVAYCEGSDVIQPFWKDGSYQYLYHWRCGRGFRTEISVGQGVAHNKVSGAGGESWHRIVPSWKKGSQKTPTSRSLNYTMREPWYGVCTAAPLLCLKVAVTAWGKQKAVGCRCAAERQG